ncbi:microtubule-associated protein futsch-like [Penaeus chinensis]|uniref:microtubule-associated protein futsch-like n=1 Tax=Penaeus chinensis TaxID=139456 RepID=UPI001FB71010|nr:microtubule-associated protein futsch-like [Penaeus chinensis]
MSPTKRRRPVKEDESLCNRYMRTQTRPSRGYSGPPRRPPAPPTRPFPPGSTDDVIRENQKPYPTRPPEELLARTRQLRGKAARDENDSLKLGTTKVLSDTFCIASEGRSAEMLLTEYRPPADSHIMVLPRPRLERRSSMPDLRDFRCVSSAVVYETIATLGRLGEARGLLVVPPRENGPGTTSQVAVPTPDIQLENQNGDKAQATPQQWARKMNKFIHEETQAVLQASPLLEGLSPSGQSGATKGRRTQRKEWISKHTSVKTLQKKILPKSVTDSSSQTDIIRPISAVHHRRNSIGSEGAESVYYDSLEEEDSRSASYKAGHQAFYVPITSEAEVAINTGPTLPARLSARLEERRASTRRHSKSGSLGVSSLALTGKRVHLIDEAKMAQMIASGEDTNVFEVPESLIETNDDIGAESDSDILDSPKVKNLKKDSLVSCSSEQDTDTSQSDIVQLSSTKKSSQPRSSQEPPKGNDSHVAPETTVNSQQHITDTYTSFSDHSNSVSSTEPLEDTQTKKTPEQSAAELTADGVNGEHFSNSEPDFNNDHNDSGKETAPQSPEQNEDIKIQVTNENGEDVDPNTDSKVNSPDLPNDDTNNPTSEEKHTLNDNNPDTEISDHYESDTFQSGSIENSINENISPRDVENLNIASIQESVDLLSASDSIEEVSENLVSETLDDEAIHCSSNDIQEDSSSSSVQEQYEIIGYTSNGKEMLLESGFIDCDDPSLLPEPLSINCDEISPTLIQTSRSEVSDVEVNEELAKTDLNLQLYSEPVQQTCATSTQEKEETESEMAEAEINEIPVEADDDTDVPNKDVTNTFTNESELQVSNDTQEDESQCVTENVNDVNGEETNNENPGNILDKSESPENEADNEELSDGTDSWDRVTVVRVSSGSTSESRNDTPDLDNEATDTLQSSGEEGSKSNDCQEPPLSPQDLTAEDFNATDTSLLDEIFRNVSPHDGNCSPVDESSSGLSTIEEDDDEHLECAQDDDVNPLLEDTVVGEQSPPTETKIHEEENRNLSIVELHREEKDKNILVKKEEALLLKNEDETSEVESKEDAIENEENDIFCGDEIMVAHDDETLNDEEDIVTDGAESSLLIVDTETTTEMDLTECMFETAKEYAEEENADISKGEDVIVLDDFTEVIAKEKEGDITDFDENASNIADELQDTSATEGEADIDITKEKVKITLDEHEANTNEVEEKADVTVIEEASRITETDEKADLSLTEEEADLSMVEDDQEASVAEEEEEIVENEEGMDETEEKPELILAEEEPDISVAEEEVKISLAEEGGETEEWIEKEADINVTEESANSIVPDGQVDVNVIEGGLTKTEEIEVVTEDETNLSAAEDRTDTAVEEPDISVAEEDSMFEEDAEVSMLEEKVDEAEEELKADDEEVEETTVEETEITNTEEDITVAEAVVNLAGEEGDVTLEKEAEVTIMEEVTELSVAEDMTQENEVLAPETELTVDEEVADVLLSEEGEERGTEVNIDNKDSEVNEAEEEVGDTLTEQEAEDSVMEKDTADVSMADEVANVFKDGEKEEELINMADEVADDFMEGAREEEEITVADEVDVFIAGEKEEEEITVVDEVDAFTGGEKDEEEITVADEVDVFAGGEKEEEEITVADEVDVFAGGEKEEEEVTVTEEVDEEEMNLTVDEEGTDANATEEEAEITVAEESPAIVIDDVADEFVEQSVLMADEGDDATIFEDVRGDTECEENAGEIDHNYEGRNDCLEEGTGVLTTDGVDLGETKDIEDIDEETVIEDMPESVYEEEINKDNYDDTSCSSTDRKITDGTETENYELDPDKDIDESHKETIGDLENDHDLRDRDEASIVSHNDSDGGESLLMSDATLDTTEPETKAEYEEILGSVLETEIKAEYEELIGSEKETSDRDTYQDMIDKVESNIEEKVYVSDQKVSRNFNSFLMKSDTGSDMTNHTTVMESCDIQHAQATWENGELNEGNSSDHNSTLGNHDGLSDNEDAARAYAGDEQKRSGTNWAANISQAGEQSECEVGSLNVDRQAEACVDAPSSASSDASPRERSEEDHGEVVAAANSPSSDSGVVEMAGKTAQSPSDASVEEVVAEDHNPRGRDAQDSSRSEESVRSAPPNRRTSSKQAKDRANRITSGRRRSSSGCVRASLDGGDVTTLNGWTKFTAPGDDSDNDGSKPRRRHWEAPTSDSFQNLPPQVDSDGASLSRHRMVQEYLDSLQNHQISKDGSPRCTVGSGPHSLNDFPTDNVSDFDTSDSGDMSYSERLLRVLESRRSRRHRPRSSNIDGEDTPTRYRPSALSALDVFLTTLSRYRGGQQFEGDPPRDPTPPPLPQDGEDNVTVQVKTGPRQHDVRVSSRRQVRLVVNVGNPAKASDSGCVADSSQSERKVKRTGPVGGGSPTGRRRPTRNVSETRAPPGHARANAASDPEVDQLLSDVREYLNKKLRQSGAEESGDQVPPEGIVVEGNNIEKCFTERPPGGGRARLYPKHRPKQDERRQRMAADPMQKERQRIQQSIHAINALLKQYS